MLIEFKTRTAGASRVLINPAQIIAVYVRADGCHIVTTERTDSGRNVHLVVEEPINRVLAKLGVESAITPSGVPVGGPAGTGLRAAREGEAARTRAPLRAGADTLYPGPFPGAFDAPLPGALSGALSGPLSGALPADRTRSGARPDAN